MRWRSGGLLIPIIITILFFQGCGKKSSIAEENKVNSLILPEYVIAEVVDNATKLYNINNGIGGGIGQVENLLDLQYNSKSQTTVKVIYIENGENLIKNKIVIEHNGEQEELNTFYSALDSKISPSGDKIAYRYYKQDSMDSIEDMTVYNIKDKKVIKLNTDTIISGNLYEFINDNEILYYGVNLNTNDRGIFKYSLDTNIEELIYKLSDGNITSLKYAGDNEVLAVKSDNTGSGLYSIDLKNSEMKKIQSDIEEIYSFNNVGENSYILAKEKGKNSAIYKWSGNLKRLTYSFPKNIDSKSPIINDDNENLYFVGYDDDKSKSDIYMIKKDGSVNLVSNRSGAYKIFK